MSLEKGPLTGFPSTKASILKDNLGFFPGVSMAMRVRRVKGGGEAIGALCQTGQGFRK
jgi:hypothetical protein